MAQILVAEDDALVGEVVHSLMRAQGHSVAIVTNGAEAVAAYGAQRPDLVILDCSLPRLTGPAARGRTRPARGGEPTPVLMLSDRIGSRDEEIATKAGATDYLRKPFSPMQLQVRVELLLAMVGYFGFC